MISLQEGLGKFGPLLIKLSNFLLQQLFSKATDSSTFVLVEVEKCFVCLISNTPAQRTLGLLIGSVEQKNAAIKILVCKGLALLFDRIQKEVFLFKDYERILKLLGSLNKDSSSEVRQAAKTSVKALADLSETPDLVHKAVSQYYVNGASTAKPLSEIASREGQTLSTASRRFDKLHDLKLKRAVTNRVANLNRTEELIKDNPAVSLRTQRPVAHPSQNSFSDAKDLPADGSASKSQLPQMSRPELMQRNRKPVQMARNYPELEVLRELIQDMDSEDWQGRTEALKISVEVLKENKSKFIRSVHLPKYFDSYIKMLEDSNQKLQIEALLALKSDLRPVFSVDTSLPDRA